MATLMLLMGDVAWQGYSFGHEFYRREIPMPSNHSKNPMAWFDFPITLVGRRFRCLRKPGSRLDGGAKD